MPAFVGEKAGIASLIQLRIGRGFSIIVASRLTAFRLIRASAIHKGNLIDDISGMLPVRPFQYLLCVLGFHENNEFLSIR